MGAEFCFAMFVALRRGISSGWRGKCRVNAWVLNWVIFGGDPDSSGSSWEKGSFDCRLGGYLGVKPVGSAHPPRRD